MSLLTGYGFSGSPHGMREEVAEQEDLVQRAALRTVPNVPILFGGFRAMVYIGMCLLAIYTAALVLQERVLSASWWLRICGPDRIATAWWKVDVG